jgi:hypothetical protein
VHIRHLLLFIPKTGPNDGSRRAISAFLPMWRRASPKPTVVVVFPSPAGVGLMAVTNTSLLSLFFGRESKYFNEIFAL